MKRTIPMMITALGGLVLIVAFFIPAFQQAGEEVAIWFNVLASIAFVLGGANLARLQLQKISDRKPGWGYAAITLGTFLLTLGFGLWKVGCPPEPGVEAYGTNAVPLPLSFLPEFSVPVASPPSRADGASFPKSVRKQLRVSESAEGQRLIFMGWMSSQQFDDLANYQNTLAWKCQIEQLFQLAQPPAELKDKVSYEAGHELLGFRGVMSATAETHLREVVGTTPEATAAIDRLAAASRRVTTLAVSNVPAGFSIPESQRETIQLQDGTFHLHGPMSIPLREQIAAVWPNFPRVFPSTPEQQSEILREIEERGDSLNERQRTIFHNYFAADWTSDALVQTLNTAGISLPQKKSFCELQAEIESGNHEPALTSPADPPVELNADQIAAVRQFARQELSTPPQLIQQLTAAGPLISSQVAAIEDFVIRLPTIATHRKVLCFRLLEAGPLSRGQLNYLLDDYRKEFHWKQQVGKLFLMAHTVKFPWSGDYSAQGSPFWWLYQYVLQPLMTTTFALLGFYVASAAFRAFRAKNLEASLLLGTAFIVLLGRTSAGPALTSWIPDSFSALRLDQATVYIMSIFGTAGNRAIMIGIALGTIATSLKVLLGIDRSYLGRDD